MAADLARLPNTGLMVQLCGDAHVQNLGSFASPDGRLTFDVNDFDETIQGPWEWDLKRMAASIVLIGRQANRDRASRRAAEVLVENYCQWMAEFARMPVLQVARHFVHREKRIRPVHAALRESERSKPLELLKKYTKNDGRGQPRFRDRRPLSWRVKGAEAKNVLQSLKAYRACLASERKRLFDLLKPVDVGFRVAGTGSVGMRDYVVLFEGNGVKDPLFLQIKQETKSAYARHLPPSNEAEHHGQRVVVGQRMFQPLSDLLLGWTRFRGNEYVVRQLNDHKGSIDFTTLDEGGLEGLAAVAGELLARGHARSGDPCAIHGYCGSGSKLAMGIRNFAISYADQTESDYDAFMAAIKAKKIRVAENVDPKD